jgi:hypothetical protein
MKLSLLIQFGTKARFRPCIHVFNPLHTYLFFTVVAKSEVILFLLAQMDSHLVISWKKLHVFSRLDIIALFLLLCNPNFDPT